MTTRRFWTSALVLVVAVLIGAPDASACNKKKKKKNESDTAKKNPLDIKKPVEAQRPYDIRPIAPVPAPELVKGYAPGPQFPKGVDYLRNGLSPDPNVAYMPGAKLGYQKPQAKNQYGPAAVLNYQGSPGAALGYKSNPLAYKNNPPSTGLKYEETSPSFANGMTGLGFVAIKPEKN